jgi:predicted SnoaL-like aldol condensation-catalyzing enzyme
MTALVLFAISFTGKITAIVEIFKVKDNRILERWDVIQEVPEKLANNHPMF